MSAAGLLGPNLVMTYAANHSYEMPAPPEGFDSTAVAETIKLVPQPPTQMTFRDACQANKFTLNLVN